MNKPHVDDMPLAQAGARFHRGRGLTVLGLVVAFAGLLLGLWLWLSHGDEARVYSELGRKLNGMRQSDFDPFWQCVLEDVDVTTLHSNTELLHWLRIAVAADGLDYAAHLREDCMATLSAIPPALDQLIAPADLEADIEALKSSTAALQKHFRAVIACLSRGEPACPAEAVAPELQGIARGWFDFQAAHASINKTLRSRLEKP